MAQFYALMPPDNASTVAVGADVSFPQNGPTTAGGGIARSSDSSFTLNVVGVYRVSFQVPVNEGGQLVVTLDGVELPYTVAGRFTGTTDITHTVLIETTTPNAVLTVRNPSSNPTALTITPFSGGTQPSAATLLIELIGSAPPAG